MNKLSVFASKVWQLRVISGCGEINKGGVVSLTVINCVYDEEFPHLSDTVQFLVIV